MAQRWIFDIGANDGRDTAFYLSKGFGVVAVDADPSLCRRIQTEQAQAIAEGRLVVVNVGIGAHETVLPFYVNEFDEWSSFKARSKATAKLSHQVIEVRMRPLAAILAEHGVPYYLKIDIEGHERDALRTLDPAQGLPAYLSFEVNDDWATILKMLRGWGYDAFQMVRQGKGILPPPPIPAREGLEVPQTFTNGHSGCFGRDLPDDWTTGSDAQAMIEQRLARAQARTAAGQSHGWHDIHARHRAAPV